MPLASLPHVELYYESHGADDQPTLVLSNSIGTNTDLWAPILDALTPHRRVITYDSRGHLRSSTPEGEYTMSDLAGDVVALLDHLEVERADFLGLSVGGLTGLQLATEHPDRLSSLAVANTGAKIGTEQSWADRAAKVRAEGLESIVDAVIAGWLTPPHRTAHPELHATLREWFLANDAEGYAATCHALGHADLRDALGSITAPTLVIGATDDGPTPPELTHQIADGVPDATWVEIPGAHLSVLESPDAFAAAVVKHLTEGDAR